MNPEQKRKMIAWLRASVSIILIGWLAASSDIHKIWQSLVHFRFIWLPIIFGFVALSVFVSAWKWKVLLSAQNIPIGLGTLFGIYLRALFFNNFLPSSIGGDGVRIFLVGKLSGRTSAAAASVVVDRTLASISLALLGLGGAIFARYPKSLAIWLMIALLGIGITATGLMLIGRIPTFIANKDGKVWRAIASFIQAAGELRYSPQAMGLNLILSLLFQFIVVLVVASVMGGLGFTLPAFADLIYITSATSVMAMIPLGLNGYGLREGAYIVLLGPLGFTASSAIAISVLFAVFVSIFSLGGAVNLAVNRSEAQKPQIKEDIA